MQLRSPESDSFKRNVRYSLLGLIFCVLNAVELVHAKFALLTLSELHAYWLGRDGHFPFMLLPWSERHFGGDALAIRLPLLVVFALMLAVVLVGLNRVIRKSAPTALVGGTLILFAALAVQQYFSLRNIRTERRGFSTLMNRVQRAAAPGEIIAAELSVAMPLYAYGSDVMRLQLRSSLHSFPDIPPVPSNYPQHEELIYVGSEKDPFAQREFAYRHYKFREYGMASADEMADLSNYYHVSEIRIYFVSPPATETNTAVSSKP